MTGVREVAEELGVELNPEQLVPIGQYVTRAANEANTELHSHVFIAPADIWAGQVATAQAEIVQMVWVDPAAPAVPAPYTMAPLSQRVIAQLSLGSVAKETRG